MGRVERKSGLGAVISGATVVVGVAGRPVGHSLSPLLHNAWIEAAGVDAVYVAFSPAAAEFARFADGLRGGVIRGLNVTAPFKEDALALADVASERARAAGAANLLIFESDGRITADNTDGAGLLAAFADRAPGFDPARGPIVILGAGGAARGAAAALLAAGAPAIRIVNRSPVRSRALTDLLGAKVEAVSPSDAERALTGANAIINATPGGPDLALEAAGAETVVMDMVYRPIETPFLCRAKVRGLRTVDGLAMLIGQARPSFQALVGMTAPDVDVRALALAALGGEA